MQITSEPATIAVSINHSNYTNQCIKGNGHFAISILGENSNPGIIGTFGFKSGRDHNKFDEVEMKVGGFLPVWQMPAHTLHAKSSTPWKHLPIPFFWAR